MKKCLAVSALILSVFSPINSFAASIPGGSAWGTIRCLDYGDNEKDTPILVDRDYNGDGVINCDDLLIASIQFCAGIGIKRYTCNGTIVTTPRK